MEVSCQQCTFSTEIDAALLPAGGMEGRCPRCRSPLPLGEGQEPGTSRASTVAEEPDSPLDSKGAAELPLEGRVSVINLIALLFLLDSILSLIKRIPILLQTLGSGAEWNLYRYKNAYDIVIGLAFFVAVFGLSARKDWGRLAVVILLSLGLTEGLYLLIDQHVALTALEKGLGESFPDLHRQEAGRLLGLILYVFFIYKLNSASIKGRFH